MTHTITFGDDGSAGSDLAWSWICDQNWSGWEVEVVRAVQPELGPPPPPALSQLHSWQPERPRERFSESHLGSIVHLTAVQDPRLLLSRPADLLVIGARGPGIAKALRLGSTAEWLLESPPGPMVITRHSTRVKRTVLATDGSADAVLATRALAALPWISDTTVHIVAIEEGLCDPAGAVEQARSILEAAQVSPVVSLLKGRPSKVLLAELEHLDPDLVALGVSGLTGWDRFRIGSTARSVAHGATCSVLVASAGSHKTEPG